jgi:UPF0271 protein
MAVNVVDINCDLGESFGSYTIGMDHEVIKYITSANIGCGYHGGDPNVMDETVKLCKGNNVAVGAHPGLPDLLGFGRRKMEISQTELANYVAYQIGALASFAKIHQVKLQHVKLHGALYNLAAVDKNVAAAIAETIRKIDDNLIFLTLANSEMENAAVRLKMRYASEIFADRNYNSDGTLVSRNHPEAFVQDKDFAAQRIVKIVREKKITAIDGSTFPVNCRSVCIHGDNPEAVGFARRLKEQLTEEKIAILPMAEIV